MRRALTPRTTLDTLRKDAKRWLKALRAGDDAARRRLREAWPKAPAEPGLRDVQHALALEYKRESWIDLRAALDDLALARKSHQERVEQLLRHGWERAGVGVARRILARHPEVAGDSLFTAATCGDLAGVESRLAQAPDAARQAGGPLNWTALAYVTYGRLDPVNAVAIAGRLLDAGADPNFRFDDGWGSPFKILTGAVGLGEGARSSHPQARELVDSLVARGADPYDHQALYNISIVGEETDWYDFFWTFCEANGRLDPWRIAGEGRLGFSFGKTTLDYLLGNAVGQDHLARALWLLARGADPDTTHAYTRQPLHALAQLSGFTAMARLLERHGAAPVALTGVEALRAACLRGDAPAARALLAAEPGLLRDSAPLRAAAEFGNAPAVRLLLSLGADVGGLDADGISALHRAVQSGSLETVDLLLAAGGNVDLRERKWKGTPLSWAGVLGRPQIAERLAPLSRDARALAWMGMTERLAAILDDEPHEARAVLPDEEAPSLLFCLPDDEKKAVAVARILLAHGADATLRNKGGETAIDAARRRGLEEAAELIEGGEAET
ncbi:MAG TPA: ankyrin repeat domain-containing protein [Allosphingosinicella sp.]|nr:ankyrin repeat domain-containing protein [Allosphingosinicella sp.]